MPTRIIAHRGAPQLAPENTLAAFKRALEFPVDGLELDVHLSADGRPVVLHDRLLDRTTSGRGPVDRLDLADLQTLDAGSLFSEEFGQERIPSLGQVLDLVNGEMEIQIELKGLTPGLAGAVLNDLDGRALQDRAVITSFAHALLRDVHDLTTDYRLGALFSPMQKFSADPELRAEEMTGLARAARASVVLAHHTSIDAATAEAIKERDFEVGVWTVDEPDDLLRMFRIGISRLTTNLPDRALNLRTKSQAS